MININTRQRIAQCIIMSLKQCKQCNSATVAFFAIWKHSSKTWFKWKLPVLYINITIKLNGSTVHLGVQLKKGVHSTSAIEMTQRKEKDYLVPHVTVQFLPFKSFSGRQEYADFSTISPKHIFSTYLNQFLLFFLKKRKNDDQEGQKTNNWCSDLQQLSYEEYCLF